MQTYEIIDPKDVGIDDNAIVLTARSGRAALKHRLHVLGVEMTQEKLDKVYEDFLKLADKKRISQTMTSWYWQEPTVM